MVASYAAWSHYVCWHGNAAALQANLIDLSPRYGKDVLRAVLNAVRAVPNGRGLGVIYWEPTWTAVPGNGALRRNLTGLLTTCE